MDADKMKKLMETQAKEIEKYKWIRSEEEKRDIGRNRAAAEWIAKYAKLFRETHNGQ